MNETAALLVDNVLPHVPVRQWVITFPIEVRISTGVDYYSILSKTPSKDYELALDMAKELALVEHTEKGAKPRP